MKNKYILLIILSVLVLFFCWVYIRPVFITKRCFNDSENTKKTISPLNISDQRFEELVEISFRDCLRKNGIKYE